MENILVDDILEKVDEIVDLIKCDSNYQRYQMLKDDISKNKEIMVLISDVKSLQKKLVLLEYEKKDTTDVSNTLNEIVKSLYAIPLYNEFINTQEEVNEVFQQVKFFIEKIINDKVK